MLIQIDKLEEFFMKATGIVRRIDYRVIIGTKG